ncbi:MAG: hypothetical protein ACRDRK_11865 [Pseudonocardia sp.]
MAGRTNTDAAFAMPEPRNGGVKTLGIKVPDSLHAQFALVAPLDGISLGDAALRAVELYVTTKKAEPDFAARAKAASSVCDSTNPTTCGSATSSPARCTT